MANKASNNIIFDKDHLNTKSKVQVMKGILTYVIAAFFSISGLLCVFSAIAQNDQFYVNGVLQSRMINLSTPETEWIKSQTKRFSPDTWHLLERYDSLPEGFSAAHTIGGTISATKSIPTFFFLKGNNKKELLLSMQTNIHEMVHAYFSYNVFRYANENNIALNWEKAEGCFYLAPEHEYFISFFRDAFFPSNELVEEIPDELRTFRFETYIDGFTSTQDMGVIGLLNEFNAYYIGSKYSYDMLEAYKVADENRVNAFLQWVGHCQSSMSAYYEFEFYIREYLRYMKQEYPENYDLLKAYYPFSEVYFSIRSLYRDLLANYRKSIVTEMQIINSIGQPVARLDGNVLWIRMDDDGEYGTPIFSEDIAVLKPILESDRFRSIVKEYPEK
jgi:hypothetical protein